MRYRDAHEQNSTSAGDDQEYLYGVRFHHCVERVRGRWRRKPVQDFIRACATFGFVTLANPNDAAAMKADSDALLPKIPGVLNYACGPHIDVGRKSIRQDYTLGILVEFANVDAYRAYQANPDHVALIKKWKPKWSKSEMFDFGAP